MIVDRTDGSDPITNYAYQYGVYDSGLDLWRNSGQITRIVDNVDAAHTVDYTYDDYDRLSTAQAGAYTRSYLYDNWGNLKQVAGSGGEASSYTLNYATDGSGAPATNRILNIGGTTAVTYDAAGNLTQEGSTTYSYDAASRLKEVGSGGQNVYGYDGDGRRVRNNANGSTPLYSIRSSVLGKVAFEAKQGDSGTRVYVYAGKQQVAVRGSDRGFYWSHTDHLGSLKKLTRTNGTVAYRAEYDPHGQRLMEWSDVSTGLSTLKFTGHEFDAATGLEYANARMYTHNRARFMQPDKLGLRNADRARPQTLNRYGYVHNDPINFNDPSGLEEMPTITGDFSVNISGGGGGPMPPGFFDGGAFQVDQGGLVETGEGGGGGERDIIGRFKFASGERQAIFDALHRIRQEDCQKWVDAKLKELGAQPEVDTLVELLGIVEFNKYESSLTATDMGISEADRKLLKERYDDLWPFDQYALGWTHISTHRVFLDGGSIPNRQYSLHKEGRHRGYNTSYST